MGGYDMRVCVIAGNWKMNTTVEEAERLVIEMLERLDRIEGVEKVLFPPFVSLVGIGMMLQNSSIKLGAQNIYTGEVSPLMLRELCEFVILGHSERRWYFGESDEVVNKKVRAAMSSKLKPVLCVGERLEENEAGRTQEVINRQVMGALNGIEPVRDLIVAYEPVWAIGTGKAASGKQAAATIQFIRDTVSGLWNKSVAQDLRILYGGSVTSANIAEFIALPEIDGALVGGASLKADEFVGIVKKASEIKGRIK